MQHSEKKLKNIDNKKSKNGNIKNAISIYNSSRYTKSTQSLIELTQQTNHKKLQ